MPSRNVVVTGASGYMGSRLIPLLLARGHRVRGVVRDGSQGKLPSGCEAIVANVLDGDTWGPRLHPADTLVHLVGVPHPSPAKARQFVEIDLRSVKEAARVAANAGIGHFVYVSVAHPAPAMKAYIEVRTACEEVIRDTGLNATILRPWYVLGPGHRWPLALIPFYKLAELIPATAGGARRLGLVRLGQMTAALTHAVEHPAEGFKVVEVPAIREAARMLQSPLGAFPPGR